jgi:hypothetical protein
MCDSPLERGGGVCYARAMKRGKTHPCQRTSHPATSREGIKIRLIINYLRIRHYKVRSNPELCGTEHVGDCFVPYNDGLF